MATMRNGASFGAGGGRRRSAEWMDRRDLDGFLHRSWLKASGVTDQAFRGKPLIGICNSWSELVNCNVHLRGLAESVAGTGVTVNAVLPGPTRSEILSNWMAGQAKDQGITQEEAEQAFLKAARPTSLIQRFATTDEVANMIVYVCSEHASATTGAALRVDGGVVRFVA